MVCEVCTHFQDTSLYHLVLKEESESIQTLKPVFDSEMNKLMGMFTTFMSNLEQLKSSPEWNKDEFEKVLQEMKILNND